MFCFSLAKWDKKHADNKPHNKYEISWSGSLPVEEGYVTYTVGLKWLPVNRQGPSKIASSLQAKTPYGWSSCLAIEQLFFLTLILAWQSNIVLNFFSLVGFS